MYYLERDKEINQSHRGSPLRGPDANKPDITGFQMDNDFLTTRIEKNYSKYFYVLFDIDRSLK